MGIYSGQGRLALVGGVIFLGALASTPVALCQQASAPGEQPGALEDIIVTAEKRSENLEKVPMSIVAYNSETLAEIGVQDFSSLAARIPGVTLNSAGRGRHRWMASRGNNSRTYRCGMAPPRPSIFSLHCRDTTDSCVRTDNTWGNPILISIAPIRRPFNAPTRCSICAPAFCTANGKRICS